MSTAEESRPVVTIIEPATPITPEDEAKIQNGEHIDENENQNNPKQHNFSRAFGNMLRRSKRLM